MPALIQPLMLVVFILFRLVLQVPLPIERGMIFPMAPMTSIWGLWNMLWLCSHARTHLPIQFHGMLLSILLPPAGALVAGCLGILGPGTHGIILLQTFHVSYALILLVLLGAMAGYYLAWKYIVGSVNRVLGIA